VSRENNRYLNELSGEILNTTEFNQFVRSEAKRQYEECSGEDYNSLTVDEQEECVIEQYKHQLDTDWKVM
jgi:hypothetical protein